METRQFPWTDALDDLLSLSTPIEKLNWRHGHKDVYVFRHEDKYWQITLDVHHSEGYQIDGPMILAKRVVPRPKAAIEWVTYDPDSVTEEPAVTGIRTLVEPDNA